MLARHLRLGKGSGSGAVLLTRQCSLYSQSDSQDGHEGLVCHGIDDGANHGLAVPPPRDPAVHHVRDAGVGEEAHSPGMVVFHDEVSHNGGGDESGEGQGIGDRVYVFAENRFAGGFLNRRRRRSLCLGLSG